MRIQILKFYKQYFHLRQFTAIIVRGVIKEESKKLKDLNLNLAGKTVPPMKTLIPGIGFTQTWLLVFMLVLIILHH